MLSAQNWPNPLACCTLLPLVYCNIYFALSSNKNNSSLLALCSIFSFLVKFLIIISEAISLVPEWFCQTLYKHWLDLFLYHEKLAFTMQTVFEIFHWLSCLYLPSFCTCPVWALCAEIGVLTDCACLLWYSISKLHVL